MRRVARFGFRLETVYYMFPFVGVNLSHHRVELKTYFTIYLHGPRRSWHILCKAMFAPCHIISIAGTFYVTQEACRLTKIAEVLFVTYYKRKPDSLGIFVDTRCGWCEIGRVQNKQQQTRKGNMTDIKSIDCWHWAGSTLRDGRALPDKGQTLVHNGPVVPCESGYHASERAIDALKYAPGTNVARVRLSGTIVPHGEPVDKHAASKRTSLTGYVDSQEVLVRLSRRWALRALRVHAASTLRAAGLIKHAASLSALPDDCDMREATKTARTTYAAYAAYAAAKAAAADAAYAAADAAKAADYTAYAADAAAKAADNSAAATKDAYNAERDQQNRELETELRELLNIQ